MDPAFKDAGKKAGMKIWRVENMKMVAIKAEDYGYFFTGDSYICLKVSFFKFFFSSFPQTN